MKNVKNMCIFPLNTDDMIYMFNIHAHTVGTFTFTTTIFQQYLNIISLNLVTSCHLFQCLLPCLLCWQLTSKWPFIYRKLSVCMQVRVTNPYQGVYPYGAWIHYWHDFLKTFPCYIFSPVSLVCQSV